jgi:hypothetical protein
MNKNLLITAALLAFGIDNSATAADAPDQMPVKAPSAPLQYDWSGPYVGFHFGYGGAASVLGPIRSRRGA